MNDDITKASDYVKAQGITGPVDVAIVLGTGLGRLADTVSNPITIPYRDIPGFPTARVSGHDGKLIYGQLEGRHVLIYQGRAHYYETGDPRIMRIPLGVAARLGAGQLLLTNASGSVRSDFRVGNLVVLRDHINFSGTNPLIGDEGDGRFVNMTDAYDERIRRRLRTAASRAGVVVHEGIYMWFSGPSFETPAEVRMAKTLGADLVGMSTVPEVLLARRFGLKLGAISIITNMASGIEGAAPSHKETRDTALASTMALERLMRRYLVETEIV